MTPSLLILSALAHAETPDAAAAADGAPVQVVVTEISAELPADAGASPEAAVGQRRGGRGRPDLASG